MKNLLPYRINNNRGFTLVELMVVITIIAILAVVGLVLFSGIQRSGRDAKRRQDIQAISKAIEVHYNTTVNQYCTAAAGTYCAVQGAWFAGGAVPTDPGTGASYTGVTAVTNGATTYNICANIESPVGTYCLTQQQ